MEPSAPKKAVNAWKATGFVWEVFFLIAVPTVLFALGGRWLDRRWHLTPWFTLLGLLLALAVSGFLVVRKAKAFQSSQ